MVGAKHLIQQAVNHLHPRRNPNEVQRGSLAPEDLDMRIAFHYGVPSTASLLAFDAVQRLLAVATVDGRIKVIGGEGIEGLLVSPKPVPYKYIEFLENQGFLVGVSNEDEIQVWNLETRRLTSCLQWESCVTAFSKISGSHFMYVGDEFGSVSVVKYSAEDSKLLQLPCIAASSIFEAAGFPSPDHQSIVGVLPQLCSPGNRVLIAYQCGLIILWDISEAQILFAGGGKDLHLKNEMLDSQNEVCSLPDDTPDLLEKEITALCWASSNGSILAVGYLDGDVLFWKIPTASSSGSGDHDKEFSSNYVVKLQLSSALKRIPVIVLHWSQGKASTGGCDGQLFIYGGNQAESEEVLTVLTLEWSSRMATLTCASRADIRLSGSFADMIVLPSSGPAVSRVKHRDGLFLLTNPGQLQFYDDLSLSALLSQQESKATIFNVNFPSIVPTSDPPITVAKLAVSPVGVNSQKIHSELGPVKKSGSITAQPGGAKWPLTGGVPSQFSFVTGFERVYMAGYQDGTVRLLDATTPVLSLICIAESEVHGLEVVGFNDPVSCLELCFLSLTLAVGNDRGMVRIYKLDASSNEMSFRLVTETKHEDQVWPQENKPHCRAVFSLMNSPVCGMQFANSGAKLAVGFECGRVEMLDMSSLSVLFHTDSVSGPRSSVISLNWIEYNYAWLTKHTKHTKHSETSSSFNPAEEVLFFLTKDGTIDIIDGGSGSKLSSHSWHPKKKIVAISMYVIENLVPGPTDDKLLTESDQFAATKNMSRIGDASIETKSHRNRHYFSLDGVESGESLMDSFLLLCCVDSLRLYSTKNIIQGNNKTIRKVKLAKPCCWTSIFKKDNKTCGLFLLFHTGVIEVRSFPDLNLVKECSLMSILRWNFKENMEKIMSSDDGVITLANGCELACILLLSSKNSFRIPESLPCLHDKVLAAAADAAFSVSAKQKKKQGSKPGILRGIVKGFKGGKVNQTIDVTLSPKASLTHLEGLFSKPSSSDLSPTVAASQETAELDIDDIEIDEAHLPTATATSEQAKTKNKEKGTEREQLFGVSKDTKPRIRTPEEIIAEYQKVGDASSAASHARKKLVERQEKLEGISRHTAELQSGAEDFASLADELVKVMENRKWWQI